MPLVLVSSACTTSRGFTLPYLAALMTRGFYVCEWCDCWAIIFLNDCFFMVLKWIIILWINHKSNNSKSQFFQNFRLVRNCAVLYDRHLCENMLPYHAESRDTRDRPIPVPTFWQSTTSRENQRAPT